MGVWRAGLRRALVFGMPPLQPLRPLRPLSLARAPHYPGLTLLSRYSTKQAGPASQPASNLPAPAASHTPSNLPPAPAASHTPTSLSAGGPASGPTKAALLAQTSSAAGRLWVHIKWPLTRNDRLFSLDDFSAVALWLVMGNMLWIILGTTTFGLMLMYLADALDKFWRGLVGDSQDSALGSVAGAVLLHGLGVNIVFQKGHVLPRFDDGMLRFANVTLQLASGDFAATVQGLDLSLSFQKWYEGKGLVQDVEISGMHARLTRAPPEAARQQAAGASTLNEMALLFLRYNDSHHVHSDTSDHASAQLRSVPASMAMDREYVLGRVKVHDSVVEVFEAPGTPEAAPLLQVQIFNGDVPRLRGDRLLVDFFNANIVTGTVNDAMFTIHRHHNYSSGDHTVRFKLDGIDMGSLASNMRLKFNWLVGGKAQVVADIRIPDMEPDAPALQPLWQKISDELSGLAAPAAAQLPDADRGLLKGAIVALYETFHAEPARPGPGYVIVDVKVTFSDLKATLPLALPMALSAAVPFVTLHNLRTLIGYVNELDAGTPVEIRTTVIERLADLHNLAQLSRTRLSDAVVGDIYDEMLRMVRRDERRILEKRLLLWSHSVMSQLLLLGLGVMV